MNRPAWRRAIAPALALVVLSLAAGLIGYFTAGSSHRSTAVAQPDDAGLSGTVASLNGDKLTLTTKDGGVDVRLPQDAPIEALRPLALSQVVPGDWLNAGTFPNRQTVFTLAGIVIIPQSRLGQPR